MTDTWERRAIANTPGYNNIGDPLIITPVFNSGNDELVITASHPVFGPVNSINFQGTFGSGTMTLGVEFVVDSPTQITVSNVGSVVSAPTDLTQLDFFSAGPVLVGTWTGTLAITAAVVFPIITNVTPGPGAGELEIIGTNLDLAVYYRIFGSVPAYDQPYYDSAGPNAGLNPVGSTVTVTPTLVTVTDAANMTGRQIDQIQAFKAFPPDEGTQSAGGAEWFGPAITLP